MDTSVVSLGQSVTFCLRPSNSNPWLHGCRSINLTVTCSHFMQCHLSADDFHRAELPSLVCASSVVFSLCGCSACCTSVSAKHCSVISSSATVLCDLSSTTRASCACRAAALVSGFLLCLKSAEAMLTSQDAAVLRSTCTGSKCRLKMPAQNLSDAQGHHCTCPHVKHILAWQRRISMQRSTGTRRVPPLEASQDAFNVQT